MDKKIIILCVFIAIIFIYIIFLFSKYNDRFTNIYKYSLMIHLMGHDISEKRLEKVIKIYNDYGIPINIMGAYHWVDDKDLLDKLPLNKENILKSRDTPGAFGLAGSFYKCIQYAYDNNWPYLILFEDDSVPILPKGKFKKQFLNVIDTLPNNGEDIYLLGFAVYCKTKPTDKMGWKPYSELDGLYISGCHSVYFGKKSIKLLYDDMNKNKLNKPIDEYIKDFNLWIWYGDLNDNGMFRGLFAQIDMNCDNVNTLPGAINSSNEGI